MPSKMIIHRQKSAVTVAAAAKGHARETQGGVAQALSPFLEAGETFPDLDLLQRLCSRALFHHRRELVQKDEAHLAELRDGTHGRDLRNAAARAVSELLVLIRDTFRTVFGADAPANVLGLGGAMLRDPVVLARKGRRVLGVLRGESLDLPPPRLPGLSMDFEAWATKLEQPLLELEAALEGASMDRRGAEATLAAKQKAVAGHDHLFLRVSRLLEELYRLGGLDDMADRVRPSQRRPGLTAVMAGGPNHHAKAPPEASEPAPEPLKLVVPLS